MIVGYCRSSTVDQQPGLAGQVEALKEAGAEKVFQEVASGTNAERLQLLQSLDFAREGDTLIITEIDRLAPKSSTRRPTPLFSS